MNLQKYNKFFKLLRDESSKDLFIEFFKKLGHPNSVIKRTTGIITPNGKFKFCLLYKHKDLLLEDNYNGIFDNEIVLKERLKEELREEEHDFSMVGDEHGHVPWHAFYSDKEDEIKKLESEVLDKSYENHYCRFFIGDVDIPFKKENYLGDIILTSRKQRISELEGKKEIIDKYKTFFEDLSMIYKTKFYLTEVDSILEEKNEMKL